MFIEYIPDMNFNIKFKLKSQNVRKPADHEQQELRFCFLSSSGSSSNSRNKISNMADTLVNAILLLDATIKAVSVVYCERK